MTLDALKPGRVYHIGKLAARNELGRRLVDMGADPGLMLKVVRNAPLEDPMEVE